MANTPFTSIRELPSGRFQARYRPRGDKGRAVKTFDTREEAEAYLATLGTLLSETVMTPAQLHRLSAGSGGRK